MAKGPVKTAVQASGNWSAAMQSDTTAQKYTQSVQNVTESPMEAAAAPDAQARYVAATAAASTSGRMAAKLRAVPLSFWKSQSAAGAARLKTGATKGKPKMDKHAQEWQQTWQQQRDAAKALPKGGVEEALAKVRAAITIAKAKAGKT